MSLIPGEGPLTFAPSVEDRQHVPFLGLPDIDLIGSADFGPDTRLAASNLWDAYRSVGLRQWVRRDLGVGWALDPRLRFLQLEDGFVRSRRDGDRLRLEAERAFLCDASGGVDLLRDELTATAAFEVSSSFLDRSRDSWATALLVPALAHVDREPRILRTNLALLEAAIQYFDRESLASVADDRGPFSKTRQLFATIVVHAKLLRDARYLRDLRSAYAEYAEYLYGYWVQAPGLASAAPPAVVAGLTTFVYPLQDETRTNVVVDRVGAFGYGYLANGIAGDCMGTGAPEFLTHPPSGYRGMLRPGQKDGFSLVVWNQVLLRNLQMHGRNRLRSQRAYNLFPCFECGAHDGGSPPNGNRAKKCHGFYWHRRQAAELSRGSVAVTQQRFHWMLGRARDATSKLGEDGTYYDALARTMRPDAAAGVGRLS